jgi:hypothetical protein
MAWYKVPAVIFLESDRDTAGVVNLVLDQLHAGHEEIIELAHAGPAETLNDSQVRRLLDFQAKLGQGLKDADAGQLISDPAHPRALLTPAAAAQLIVLEAESEPPDVK